MSVKVEKNKDRPLLDKELFVDTSVSEAINEVDTNEKNNPVIKRVITIDRINLSKFFHHW